MVKTETVLRNATNIVELAATNIDNEQTVAVDSLNFAHSAQKRFIRAETKLSQAMGSFITAENDSLVSVVTLKQVLV